MEPWLLAPQGAYKPKSCAILNLQDVSGGLCGLKSQRLAQNREEAFVLTDWAD